MDKYYNLYDSYVFNLDSISHIRFKALSTLDKVRKENTNYPGLNRPYYFDRNHKLHDTVICPTQEITEDDIDNIKITDD